jgi:hypothetical protein
MHRPYSPRSTRVARICYRSTSSVMHDQSHSVNRCHHTSRRSQASLTGSDQLASRHTENIPRSTMHDTSPPPYQQSNEIAWQTPLDAHHTSLGPLTLSGASTSHRQGTQSPTKSSEENESKLDFTQRIERKLAEYNASNNVFKRWLFEMSSWLVAAVSMGAIVGIYIWLKEKPMSEVGELLTCANILGKVASAALIVPTTEALGQLKWNWFHNSRAMWDFEIFDKASRCESSDRPI